MGAVGQPTDVESRAEVGARSAEEHQQTLDAGDHIFSALQMTDVVVDGADLAIALELSPRFTNPRGGLQGGLVATLADIVAGRAANDRLDPGFAAVTADLHVHYLASITAGPAIAAARIVRRGRRSIVVQVDIFDGHGGPLAAVCTLAWAVVKIPV